MSSDHLRTVLDVCDLTGVLKAMENGGSSVVLTYGEDNGAWECSWIVGGERFTTWSPDVWDAVYGCVKKVITTLEPVPAHGAGGEGEAG